MSRTGTVPVARAAAIPSKAAILGEDSGTGWGRSSTDGYITNGSRSLARGDCTCVPGDFVRDSPRTPTMDIA